MVGNFQNRPQLPGGLRWIKDFEVFLGMNNFKEKTVKV